MASQVTSPQVTSPKTEVADANHLAVERTYLAHERTLMAWVRTGTSLISFGFTIYKFFQYLRESGQIAADNRPLGARRFAIMMIVIGLVAELLATIQHYLRIRILRKFWPEAPRSLALFVAAMVSILGVLALLAVIFRQ